ncbi:2-hydroxyacyl-CoA dehydratase [Candidatus Poribacteria bacterium]|nr:2-hydroxyacyl-CoA dehydratase [Candidatus Poribacteria bacterium]
MEKIGITTTIPIEIILAAGYKPVDLNNIFITSDKASSFIEEAEKIGFPRTTCSWIKGVYIACLKSKIKKVIGVVQGDCSNTHALMETLQLAGIEVIPFSYPYDKDPNFLHNEIQKIINKLGTSWDAANNYKKYLDNNIRKKLQLIDNLTWQKKIVHGEENHYFLVNSSDFKGDLRKFENEIDLFLKKIENRKPIKNKINLGYIGVPAIFSDLYKQIEYLDGHVVFNEIQRQFSMPNDSNNITEQYLQYTYPYSVFGRLKDIEAAIQERKIHGIINYVQTFCFHHIEDIILRKKLNIPILTIEGDKPDKLDARTRLRLETFMQMLKI